jgi:acetaldehyde dehydrogenase (acetylating)
MFMKLSFLRLDCNRHKHVVVVQGWFAVPMVLIVVQLISVDHSTQHASYASVTATPGEFVIDSVD